MAADIDTAEVVRFWRTIELFSPPRVPDVKPRAGVDRIARGRPLPWEPDVARHRAPLRKGWTWRHAVYIGVYSLEQVFEVLEQVLQPDEESYDARPPGASALAAFTVSAQGRYLEGSEVLSSCAWSTGRARRPGPRDPNWLQGFERSQALFAIELAEALAQMGDSPLDVNVLTRCRDAVAAQLGVCGTLRTDEMRVETSCARIDSEVEAPFLNSFVLDDLAGVSASIEQGRYGQALRDYLCPGHEIDTSRRVDVRRDRDSVFVATRPDAIPLGRWPSPVDQPLALSQQLAVNGIVESLAASRGVFAVNGPPGTGKTTLLRELVADLVVQRAGVLASLSTPADAFDHITRWQTGIFTRTIHHLRPELTGFEIVVASSKNGAVENVTTEIPDINSIGEGWRGDVDEHANLATELLNDRGPTPEDDDSDTDLAPPREAWGLIAGRLGRQKFRSRFADVVWWGRENQGLMRALDGADDASRRSWSEAVADLEAARRRAVAMASERQAIYEAVASTAQTDGSCDAGTFVWKPIAMLRRPSGVSLNRRRPPTANARWARRRGNVGDDTANGSQP